MRTSLQLLLASTRTRPSCQHPHARVAALQRAMGDAAKPKQATLAAFLVGGPAQKRTAAAQAVKEDGNEDGAAQL